MLGSHCRAIRYERHDWLFVAGRGIFSEISGLDTRWCESIRSNTICCARMRSTRFVNFRCHDQSRSDLPFRYAQITCEYVQIRSSRTDALRYDSIRLWSRCFSRSWSRVITIRATTAPRREYIQPNRPWTSFDFRNSMISSFCCSEKAVYVFFFFFFFFLSLGG